MIENILNDVVKHLRSAKRILFITGAGISADSGLPTYRGIGGLYNDQLTRDNIPIEVALSGNMLLSHPEITWKYLLEIEQACRHATFNQGHEIINKIAQKKPDTWILTQNIDGFHHQAGSRNVIEIHGKMLDLYCLNDDYKEVVKDFGHLRIPPQCPFCRGPIRPNIVLFGEMLPIKAVETLSLQLQRGFDLIFTIGTTSVFPYIAQPIVLAKQQGIPTVEINPSETMVSHLVDYKINNGAADTLTQLWYRWQQLIN